MYKWKQEQIREYSVKIKIGKKIFLAVNNYSRLRKWMIKTILLFKYEIKYKYVWIKKKWNVLAHS